jgi:hypothetical protein
VFMTPKICVQASNLSYHLHKSHYTLIPKRFKDCVPALVHPPPFTNPHCTLTPKDRKFQRFCTSLHTHHLIQIHTVLSHPKIESFKDFVQALAHPPPYTNPHCTLTPKDRKFQRFCTSSCTPTSLYKSTLYSHTQR